ncbi:GNAT family N-acetyltransferase [Chloroflexota bacterium]
MSHSRYIIRNYRHSDFADYVKLIIASEKRHPSGCRLSPQSIGENLKRPNYSPEQDLFVAEIDGKIVGFIDIIPEINSRRVILDCLVHPEHRRRGLAKKLLGCATRRAKELKAIVARVNIRQDNIVAKNILTKLGFKIVRQFLELRLSLTEVRLPDNAHHNYASCHLQYGEAEKLTRIQNRCFANVWGYNPNTTEEIACRIKMSHRSSEDVVLIYDTDKLVGYCWAEINRKVETDNGDRKGRIYMLGVDPDCRGKGIGRIALLAGLTYLKSKGIRVVELTVDSENEAALALYSSVGFKKWSSSLWYEKKVD